MSINRTLYAQLSAGDDLDDYTSPGCYFSVSADITSKILNLPKGLKNGFKLIVDQITFNSYFVQKIIENATGNTFIRACNGGTYTSWITHGLMSVFNTFSQLGITSRPCTTLQVFKAMPDNSIAYLGVDQTSAISDLPTEAGCLEITRITSIRYKIILYRSRGGDVPAIKDIYIATVNQALTQLTWEKVALMTDIPSLSGYATQNWVNQNTVDKYIDTKVANRVEQRYGNISVVTTDYQGVNAVSGFNNHICLHIGALSNYPGTVLGTQRILTYGFVRSNQYSYQVVDKVGDVTIAVNNVGTVSLSSSGSEQAVNFVQTFILIPFYTSAIKS